VLLFTLECDLFKWKTTAAEALKSSDAPANLMQ